MHAQPVTPRIARGRGPIVVVAALILGAPQVHSQVTLSASIADSLRSPTLRRLQGDMASGNATAHVATFWSMVRASGTPLVELTSQPAYRLVTFVFRGGDDITGVRLDAGFNALLVKSVKDDATRLGLLSQLAGSDIWYLSIELGRTSARRIAS